MCPFGPLGGLQRATQGQDQKHSRRVPPRFSTCVLLGCRPGVPSAVLARVSTQEPGRSLAFEAAPLPPRGQRLDKTRNLTPRHLPLTEGLSSPAQGQDFPLHPGEGTPKERDPPVAGRRGQCGLGQGKFREALCANSGGACVPASEPCPANRLALLSPIPVFFPRLARLVASHLSEGGGGGSSRTAQHAFSTLCQFFVKASLEELVKNCDSGVLCHATSELFWETKTSEK